MLMGPGRRGQLEGGSGGDKVKIPCGKYLIH